MPDCSPAVTLDCPPDSVPVSLHSQISPSLEPLPKDEEVTGFDCVDGPETQWTAQCMSRSGIDPKFRITSYRSTTSISFQASEWLLYVYDIVSDVVPWLELLK